MQNDPLMDRLVMAIKATQLKLTAFSEVSGIPYPSLRDYARKKRKPGMDAIASILRVSSVSADWLFSGKGDMYRGPTEEEIDPMFLWEIANELNGAAIEMSAEQFGGPMLCHWSARIYNKLKGIPDAQARSKAIDKEAKYLVEILESENHLTELWAQFPQAIIPAKLKAKQPREKTDLPPGGSGNEELGGSPDEPDQ